jgi:hypothetical protein
MRLLARCLLEQAVGGEDDTPEVLEEPVDPERRNASLLDPSYDLMDPASFVPAEETSTSSLAANGHSLPTDAHGSLAEQLGLYDIDPSNTVEHFDNGAVVARDADGHPIFQRSPPYYDPDGALKPMDVQVEQNREWADYRLENGLNTVGPDGHETGPFWSRLGGSHERQLWGAYHDLQSPIVHTEALEYAELHPDEADRVMRNERLLTGATAIVGYGVTRLTEGLSELGLPLVAPPSQLAAYASASIYRMAGYTVPTLDPFIKSKWSKP